MPATAKAPATPKTTTPRKRRTRKAMTTKPTPVAKVTTTKFVSNKVVEKKSELIQPDVTLLTPAQYKQDILNRWAIHNYEIQEFLKDCVKVIDFLKPYHAQVVKMVTTQTT